MITGTLSRYFGMHFLRALIGVFVGVLVLVTLIDYIEMMRRAAGEREVSAWLVAQTSLFRVPQLTERIMPFAVLIGAMSCYLGLSRRNELVVARSAGISAWRFHHACAGCVARFRCASLRRSTNPVAAVLNEQSKRLESCRFSAVAARQSSLQASDTGFWLRQKSEDGQSIIHARHQQRPGSAARRCQRLYVLAGRQLSGPHRSQLCVPRGWLLAYCTSAGVYGGNEPPIERPTYQLRTNPDIRPGSRKLCDSESGAVLGICRLTSTARARRSRPLPATNCGIGKTDRLSPFSLCAMVLLGICREPEVLPASAACRRWC